MMGLFERYQNIVYPKVLFSIPKFMAIYLKKSEKLSSNFFINKENIYKKYQSIFDTKDMNGLKQKKTLFSLNYN
jgi:hypothetical protein